MHIARLDYVFLLILFSSLGLAADGPSVPPPPSTRKVPVTETLHGITITDPYRWLEDQDSPETRQWIDQQNAYTHSVIDKLPGRDAISERLSQLMKIDAINVPTERNGKLVYTERKADQDLYVVHLRESSGKDEVLIDPHPLSPDHTTGVSMLEFSHDGSLLAYGIRRGGADEVEVHLKDVNSKKDLSDVLPKARYFGLSFLPDKSGFYYSIMLKQGPRIRLHKMGTDAKQDEEIFGEKLSPVNITQTQVSDDGKFLLIHVDFGAAADKSEVYAQDLSSHGPIKPIITDIPARFFGGFGGDTTYEFTNWKAPNGRIIAIDLNDPSRDKWREVVPEAADAMDEF